MKNINMRSWTIICVISFIISATSGINLREGPLNAQVRPGATVELKCNVDQKRGITVYWYRLESREYLSHDRVIYTRLPVDRRRRYSVIGNRAQDVFTLRMSNVVLADDGTYQCGYANGIGRFNVLASARVTILISPSADSPICYITTISGNAAHRKVGDVVDMVCTAEGGNPNPDLTWFRGEEELEENEGGRYAVHRQIMRPQDANLNYTCVMRAPLIVGTRSCSVSPMQIPPIVRIEPAVNPVTLGSTATFTCSMFGDKIGVRSYSWNVDAVAARRLQETPGRMRLKHNDRVLEIYDIQPDDDKTVVTCQAQTNRGELLKGTATLVIVIEPTGMTTDILGLTTEGGNEDHLWGTSRSWHRDMRPTRRGGFPTEYPDTADRNTDESSGVEVTVDMGPGPEMPAFLKEKTFIVWSAAGGTFVVICIVVIIIIVKIVRRKSEKKIPITNPTISEHGSDAYATIIEMKRNNGSTYKGSATFPALKSERKLGLKGGSSLSLSARNSVRQGQATERSPLYAKPDKLRNSKNTLIDDSRTHYRHDSSAEELEYMTVKKSEPSEQKDSKDGSMSATLFNKDLNAEGLIYADLVLNEKGKPKNIFNKKGTQYASIIPSGKP